MITRSFAVLLLLLSTMGCSRSGYEFAPVSGKVLVEGKPMAGLHVAFEPIGSQKHPLPGPGSIGVTNAEGVYTLLSVPDKTKGAVVGKHRIRIVVQKGENRIDSQQPDDEMATTLRTPSTAFQQLPPRYHDSTELTFEVPAKGTTSANFELFWK